MRRPATRLILRTSAQAVSQNCGTALPASPPTSISLPNTVLAARPLTPARPASASVWRVPAMRPTSWAAPCVICLPDAGPRTSTSPPVRGAAPGCGAVPRRPHHRPPLQAGARAVGSARVRGRDLSRPGSHYRQPLRHHGPGCVPARLHLQCALLRAPQRAADRLRGRGSRTSGGARCTRLARPEGSFIEDPVRMIRAVKYARLAGFTMERRYRVLISRHAGCLAEVLGGAVDRGAGKDPELRAGGADPGLRAPPRAVRGAAAAAGRARRVAAAQLADGAAAGGAGSAAGLRSVPGRPASCAR